MSVLFSTPDYPAGGLDYASLQGIEEDDPFVTGPAAGGFDDTTAGTTGLLHVSTGANPTGHAAGRQPHWSNLLDVKHGPLFWLLFFTVLYFGLVSLQVGVRVGRR